MIQAFISSDKVYEFHAIGYVESSGAVKSTGCQTHFYDSVFDEKEKIRILAPCDYAFNMMKELDYEEYRLPELRIAID